MPLPSLAKPERIEFDSIADAVSDLQKGRPVVVVDDEDRENEGDVVVAAEFASADLINFMASSARGLICVPMLGADLDRLAIPMMVTNADDRVHASPFTVSVEAAKGVTTGISAADRAETIRVLASASSVPVDIAMPGHVFPLRAHPDGVMGRRGHTEASIDLVKLAGLRPVAVICEIMNHDGTMARRDQLSAFARAHNIRIVTISDLHTFLLAATDAGYQPRGLDKVDQSTVAETQTGKWSGFDSASRDAGAPDAPTREVDGPPSAMTEAAALPTKYGAFRVFAYVDEDKLEHLALVHGDVSTAAAPIVRVHSECLTGDALASLRCDCGDQLNAAMKRIEDEGSGVLLYLRQEGRGIGLANKIRAYTLQDQGLDTVEANQCLGFEPDERNYDVAVSMLGELGVSRIRLLTNNPAKISSLERGGVEVETRLALTISREENRNYLQTKAEKLQHLL